MQLRRKHFRPGSKSTTGPTGFLDLKWFSPGLLKPLVKAAGSYKLEVKSEDRSCGDEEGYHPNQLKRIELGTAVFADGSYEDSPAWRRSSRARRLGIANTWNALSPPLAS